MIPPSIFKTYKCDTESLKGYFTAKKPSDQVKALIDLIRERIKDGRLRSLMNYKTWAAVDMAYNAPFNQETPTLIKHIMSTCKDAKSVLNACKQWGLSEENLFCEGKNESGEKVMELNVPAFFEILVPVVRAYFSVRLAKIFNDRNLDPLYKYEPKHYNEKNRILCEVITDITDTMSVTFGYANNLKQVIFNALLYSVAIEFPLEAWYEEKQKDEDDKDVVTKAGVRYFTPHITRIGYDLQYPIQTFNTDTGNTFAFYWSILRWGDVERKKSIYWNTDKVTFGGIDWLAKDAPYANYFEQVYPCTLKLPVFVNAEKGSDRENDIQVYTSTQADKAVFVTHMFMKIIPKEYGLGHYPYPVWFRFIVGADDAILYAEPFPYCPITAAYYDPDQNRSTNASLGLELIPWQDLIGNTLTQLVLTTKRNLANIIFYDTQLNVGDKIEAIQRRSAWQYSHINMIPIDQLKAFRAGVSSDKSIHEIKFQYQDTTQLVTSINMQLMLMERMLGISAQEIGSPASHQQGNKEIELIAASASNRVTYTASGIDDYVHAKKCQLHEANLAYRDEDVVAEISADIDQVENHLKELGFDVTTKTQKGIVVKGKKKELKRLSVQSFTTQRDGPERYQNAQVAQAMYTALAGMAQNPALLQILDPVSIKEMYEIAARFSGADEDFALRLNQDGVMANQLSQLVQQLTEAISQKVIAEVGQSVAKPAAEAMHEQEEKNVQQDQQLLQLTEQLAMLQSKIEEFAALAAQAVPQQPVNYEPSLQPLAPAAI